MTAVNYHWTGPQLEIIENFIKFGGKNNNRIILEQIRVNLRVFAMVQEDCLHVPRWAPKRETLKRQRKHTGMLWLLHISSKSALQRKMYPRMKTRLMWPFTIQNQWKRRKRGWLRKPDLQPYLGDTEDASQTDSPRGAKRCNLQVVLVWLALLCKWSHLHDRQVLKSLHLFNRPGVAGAVL